MAVSIEGDDYLLVEQAGTGLEVVVIDPSWTDKLDWPNLGTLLERVLVAISAQFQDPLGHGAVSLANDAHVLGLNRQYRDKDSPTNVLSFPDDDPTRLGDIILAVETCAHEASRDEKLFEHHFIHLIVHAMLHLIGFDHTNDVNAAEMESLETAILADLGVPDPYDAEEFDIG